MLSTDLKQYLSGGSGNTSPAASTGGAISTTEITDNTLNNLWDDVSGAEHTAGDTEYRCFYLKNTNGTDTAQSLTLYIASNTTAAEDTIAIGLDPAGIDGTATTIANENTAPAGVTFSTPSSGSPLSVGNVTAGQKFAVWVRRTVTAGSTPQANNAYQLTAEFEAV